MTSAAVALIAQIYTDAGSGKWDAIAPHMAEDLVIYEADSLPFGGAYRGRDALERLFGTVMGYWIDPHVDVDAIVGDESHVVVLLRLTMTSRHTGRRFTQPVTEVSVVRDGQVAEMRIHYYDTAEIAREAGPAR